MQSPASIESRFPRPSVMGVVNVTPDSFSDGGVNFRPEDAIASARRIVEEGAAIVDVGGESTRPGAEDLPADEELNRVEQLFRKELGAQAGGSGRQALEVAGRRVEDCNLVVRLQSKLPRKRAEGRRRAESREGSL